MTEEEKAQELQATLTDLDLVLTDNQKQCIEDLRTMIEAQGVTCVDLGSQFRLDDPTLLRFLVARQFNVLEATTFLKQHMEWRDMMLPSSLTTQTILPSLASSGIYRLMGETKEGHPIIQFQLKLLDPYAQELSDYTKYVVFVIESSIRKMKNHYKNVWIFDLEGWGMTTHGTTRGNEFTRETLMLAQNQYPERLHTAFIVNAPWLFSTAWNLIAGWLDEKTQKKVRFLKSRKELYEFIDPSILPKAYYGTHEDYPSTFDN